MHMIPIRWALLALLLLPLSPQPASAFYDPGVQRWLNRDPVGDVGAPFPWKQATSAQDFESNPYTYVRGSPIDFFDPLGLNVAAISPGACQVLAVAGGSIAAALASVPAGAIVTGIVVVGGACVVTYAICHPLPETRTWCPSQVNAPPISITKNPVPVTAIPKPRPGERTKTCTYACDGLPGLPVTIVVPISAPCPVSVPLAPGRWCWLIGTGPVWN
jgi:RHS repeat-associated protein